MSVVRTLRVASAVLILVCAVLPVTKCTQPFTPNGTSTTYEYLWDDLNPRETGSWLLLLVFVWPLVSVLIRGSAKDSRTVLLVRILEPLLVTGSLYVLYLQTIFTSGFAIGGRLAFGSLVCFGVASSVDSIAVFVRRLRDHPRQSSRRRDLTVS